MTEEDIHGESYIQGIIDTLAALQQLDNCDPKVLEYLLEFKRQKEKYWFA